MATARIPMVISTMMAQLGGPMGAVAWTGGRDRLYSAKVDGRPSNSSTVTESSVSFDVGLMWRVNAKGLVKAIVTYEPDDTYTVRYVRFANDGRVVVLEERDDVYADTLQRTVESMYSALCDVGFVPQHLAA